ncbi:MAG: hypothetical protein Q9159_001983 [Coniocarpon cinnabarinum]
MAAFSGAPSTDDSFHTQRKDGYSHDAIIPQWILAEGQRLLTKRYAVIAIVVVFSLLFYIRLAIFPSDINSASRLSPAGWPLKSSADRLQHLLDAVPDVTTTEGLLLPSSPMEEPIDWSKFAYTQYATTPDYLCNSLMLFERLQTLGSRAQRVLLYPDTFHHSYPVTYETSDAEAQAQIVLALLLKAEREYDVTLKPIEVLRKKGIADSTWAESYTKLLAFNQTEFTRVLNLDSDATLLQDMDELFFIPGAPVAMPRAYWLPHLKDKAESKFTSLLMLVEPSEEAFARIQQAITAADGNTYDMEIMNNLFGESSLVIPHRRYGLLTGELFASEDQHRRYLGNEDEAWDANATIAEAKFLHFSNWPLPKPWIKPTQKMIDEVLPTCKVENTTETDAQIGSGKRSGRRRRDKGADCEGKRVWEEAHEDFRRRRLEVCGMMPQNLAH